MIAVDALIKLLQHQMGHASVTISLNLYGHLYAAARVEAEWKDEGDPR